MMQSLRSGVIVGMTFLVAFGCQSTPESTPKLDLARAKNVRPTSLGVLPIVPDNTAISFVGSAMLKSQPGWFEKFVGELEMPTDNPVDAKLKVDVDMNSLETNIGLLTKHLRKAEFFDVERFPSSSFVSTQVTSTNASVDEFLIRGVLTFRGVAREVEVPATFRVTNDELMLTAKLTIVPSQHGMKSAENGVVTDAVPVTVTARIRRI